MELSEFPEFPDLKSKIELAFQEIKIPVEVEQLKDHKFLGTHLQLTFNQEVDPYRMEQLLTIYFQMVLPTGNPYSIIINPAHFNPDGHDGYSICKRCGCTHNDACYDFITGSCWWVTPKICSACASSDEIQIALNEFKNLPS